MLESAARLCDAYVWDYFFDRDGEALHVAATQYAARLHRGLSGAHRFARSAVIVTGRIVHLRERVVHVNDLAVIPEDIRVPDAEAALRLGGVRTMLGVPLLREERSLIGVIRIYRQLK